VEQVGKIDPGLTVSRVDLQRTAEPVEGAGIVPQSVGGVAQAGRSVGRFGVGPYRQVEEPVGGRNQSFTEQGASDLQHELVIVLEPELKNALDRPHGTGAVAQLEQGFAQACQTVLMIRIQRQSLLEAPSGPGVFLTGQMGVGSSDVQFDRVRVQRYAFIENGQGFIVAAFVIEMMGLFVEIVGAEECVRHRQDLLDGLTTSYGIAGMGARESLTLEPPTATGSAGGLLSN